jgi:hypothetical protein
MRRHAREGLASTGPAIGRSSALPIAGVWELVGVRTGAAPAPVPPSGPGADRRQRRLRSAPPPRLAAAHRQRETCNARRVPFYNGESTCDSFILN